MTMARFPHARGFLWIFTAAVAFAFSGCGDSASEGLGTPTEEHKEATNKMAEFMKTQGKKK
jgi:hypothetical protein